MTFDRVKAEMDRLLNDSGYREHILRHYSVLKEMMGEKGASERTAKLMIELMRTA